MNRILRAIKYGANKMEGMKRKKNERDYFTDHCMRLLGYVACDPLLEGDEDAAIIIILHDVVEDCTNNDTDEERQVLYDEITELFGSGVQKGVHDLTDEFTKKRHPDKNRQQRQALELERQKKIYDRSKRLKLWDRYANLQDMLEVGDNNRTYARESWDMGYYLSDPYNFIVAIKVMTLAAKMRDNCKNNLTPART
jgi:(p)ppGpp synthase/HD superfamily hydrolase